MTEAEQLLADIQALSPDLAIARPKKATIRRPGAETNEFGDRGKDVVATDRPCRVTRSSSRQALPQDFTVQQALWDIAFELGEDVHGDDEIEVDGATYTVVALLSGTYAAETKVRCSGGPR